MGVGDDFKQFCSNLTINNRDSIGERYQLITRRLNLDFWSLDCKTSNSRYVGSYGRGTSIRGFSDLDMIFSLPYDCYRTYDNYLHNGQSSMLQSVKRSLQKTYPTTDVAGDGQVVVVSFTDGITFEIVPAFLNNDGSYTYPDANGGGKWRTTNPKPEINTISAVDSECNGNLKWLCRMMRAWKNQWHIPMGGLLIDSLALRFIKNWQYRDKSFYYYDWMSRDFFAFLANEPERSYWLAVGSGQYIWSKGNFQHRAGRCYMLAKEAIDSQENNQLWSARQKWREIYGTTYPSS